jgi:hypothetical protein
MSQRSTSSGRVNYRPQAYKYVRTPIQNQSRTNAFSTDALPLPYLLLSLVVLVFQINWPYWWLPFATAMVVVATRATWSWQECCSRLLLLTHPKAHIMVEVDECRFTIHRYGKVPYHGYNTNQPARSTVRIQETIVPLDVP